MRVADLLHNFLIKKKKRRNNSQQQTGKKFVASLRTQSTLEISRSCSATSLCTISYFGANYGQKTYHLQNIHTFPRESQVFALKSTFSLKMLEMVNKVLNIPENAKCDDILDAIQNGLRATRNVAIDRIEFVQCR